MTGSSECITPCAITQDVIPDSSGPVKPRAVVTEGLGLVSDNRRRDIFPRRIGRPADNHLAEEAGLPRVDGHEDVPRRDERRPVDSRDAESEGAQLHGAESSRSRHGGGAAGGLLLGFERIDHGNARTFHVPDVTRCHGQPVDCSGRREERIDHRQRIWHVESGRSGPPEGQTTRCRAHRRRTHPVGGCSRPRAESRRS